jgi:hypothetical protein
MMGTSNCWKLMGTGNWLELRGTGKKRKKAGGVFLEFYPVTAVIVSFYVVFFITVGKE